MTPRPSAKETIGWNCHLTTWGNLQEKQVLIFEVYFRHPLGVSSQQENMLEFRIEYKFSRLEYKFWSHQYINSVFKVVKWAEINKEVNVLKKKRGLRANARHS